MTDYEAKYKETKEIIQSWVDQQGHDRCWYYPDLFNRLVEVYQITAKTHPNLPALDEFRKGCERYQREEYQLKDIPK